MKTTARACLIIAALAAGTMTLAAAGGVRLRFLAAVYFDDKGGGIKAPEGVACDGRGNVIVADTGNARLLRFTYRDSVLAGGTEIKIPELAAPVRVQLNAKGDILALDGKLRRIVRLSAQGEFKGTLALDGVPGTAPVVVRAFAVDGADNIYVLDTFSGRILVLDSSGKFQSALALPSDAGFIADVAVESSGRVLALDAGSRRLFAAAEGGGAVTPLGGDLPKALETMPTSVMASRGMVFISEGVGSRVLVVGQDGSVLGRQLTQGWDEGQLNRPSQMCVNDKDELFIADRDNSRIQVFQLTR